MKNLKQFQNKLELLLEEAKEVTCYFDAIKEVKYDDGLLKIAVNVEREPASLTTMTFSTSTADIAMILRPQFGSLGKSLEIGDQSPDSQVTLKKSLKLSKKRKSPSG